MVVDVTMVLDYSGEKQLHCNTPEVLALYTQHSLLMHAAAGGNIQAAVLLGWEMQGHPDDIVTVQNVLFRELQTTFTLSP